MTDLDVSFKIEGSQLDYIAKIKMLVEEVLGLNISPEEILNTIIDSYINKQTYVSLFPLTKQLRLSIDELEKATYFTNSEQDALEYAKATIHRNTAFKALASLAKRDYQDYGKLELDFDGTNAIIDQMWAEVAKEIGFRYRNFQFRGGVTVLIIKISIIYAILR